MKIKVNKMKKFIEKVFKALFNKETITYIIFGALTTAVNYAVFWAGIELWGEDYHLLINAVAFILSAAFAYVTNKLFVFESKSWAFKVIAKEIPSFFSARLASFFFEEAGLLLFVDILKVGEKEIFGISGVMIVKLVLAVIVVIVNYILSKFLIFKKKKD